MESKIKRNDIGEEEKKEGKMINKVKNKSVSARMCNLIKKIEKAPDFGYDDEEVELQELCNEKGLFWCWNDSIFKAEILLTDDVQDIENMNQLINITKD